MQIRQIVEVLEALAPTCHAEAWDNVGLLWGDPYQQVEHLLLTNDCTSAVLDEAERLPCQLVVSYHPPLFKALKKIPATHVMHRALQSNIAVYSPHTAWDAAVGGTNDRLCDALGLIEREPLRASNGTGHYKLIFFAPPTNVEAITDALTRVGAGRIGLYSGCHFRSSGVGVFSPEVGSKPAIGHVGAREEVEEWRVEMVVPKRALAAAINALRAHHPYDEPAFDVLAVEFSAPPGVGMGRIGRLPKPLTWDMALDFVKKQLGLSHVLACKPKGKHIERVAVCAGAGGEFVGDAASMGAQLLVTGEVRHHDALAAQERGFGVIATLHSNSERLTLPFMADRLRARMQEVNIHVSACDADPLDIL